jgi:hypothetical protein
LSQWRVYGRETGSYCIGFDTNELSNCFSKVGIIRLVEYNYDRQFEFLKALVAEVIRKSDVEIDKEPKNNDGFNEIAKLTEALDAAITMETARYKMCPFEVEQEWRFVVMNSEAVEKGFSFRVSRFGVTPYLRLCLSENHADLPITRIDAGPSRYPQHSEHALVLL